MEASVEDGGGFRDEFDTSASLDEWELFRSRAEVFDGVLYVIPDGTGAIGSADRVFDAPLTDWRIGVSMARGVSEEGVIAWFVMAHPRFRFWRLAIGPFGDNNYQLAVFDATEGDYIPLPNLSGHSDEISDELNEFTEMTPLHRDGQFALLAGGVELFRLNSAEETFRGAALDHMLASVDTIWLGSVSAGTASFDWAYASGTEVGASAANATRPGNRTDTLRPGKRR